MIKKYQNTPKIEDIILKKEFNFCLLNYNRMLSYNIKNFNKNSLNLPKFNLNKLSYIRAYNDFTKSIRKGYKSNKYKIVNNGIFLKNDVDKALMFNVFSKSFKSLKKLDDSSSLYDA